MKKIFLLLFLLTGIFHIKGQTQVAILCHGDEILTYYGVTAFTEAYNNAENGDVITLSSGQFDGVDIEKAITIRGAGMETINQNDPTIVYKNLLTINAPEDSICTLTIEGIDLSTCSKLYIENGENVTFLKCDLNYVNNKSSASILKNTNFIHCKINQFSFSGEICAPLFLNSFINDVTCSNKTNYLYTFTNCIILENSSINNFYKSNIKNCIFIYTGSTSPNGVDSKSTVYNSLWYGKDNSNGIFFSVNSTGNNSVWESEASPFIEDTFYVLTEEAKAYIGTDGTEIGLYGGNLPFDPTPSNPQITKCSVAAKTTVDGKLSVDIEVSGAN